MTVDKAGNIDRRRYWDLEDKNDWHGMDDESLIKELKTRFRNAVKVRLESDYPLAAELSEGLDSNGIVGYAAQMLGNEPLYTLSYMCEKLDDANKEVWEKTYQDIFEMLDMHSNLKPLWCTSARDNKQDMESFHQHAGGVMGINGGHFLRSHLAHKQGARVLLSGWGGDHCVSTYGDFYESELFLQGKWLTLSRLFRGKHKRGRAGKPLKMWVGLMLKHMLPPLYHRIVRSRGGLEKAMWERAEIHPLKKTYLKRYKLRQKLKCFTDSYQRYTVKEHHRRELFDVGVEGRLVESELCGRMFRTEYRYPMLDVPLVELAYNMPSHLKIREGLERYMFRRVLEGVTTERIQWRVKADVNHPQIDFNNKAEIAELGKQLLDSDLVHQYCDKEKLSHCVEKATRLHSLNYFQLLIHIEKQMHKSHVQIADE